MSEVVDPRTVPVRFSHLRHLSQSPLHYWHAVQVDGDPTRPMRLGVGAHAMLFEQPVVLYPGKVRNGKEWDAFKAEHEGVPILSHSEWDRATSLAAAVRGNELAMQVLTGTVKEQVIEWSFLGRACRSTLDARGTYHLVDVKTTKCADPDRFARDAVFRHYHAQLAFYADAVKESGLGDPREAYIIAVESQPPFPVTVLKLTERALDQGRRLCRLWFERLLACEAANDWPGYAQSVVELDVPMSFDEMDEEGDDDE